MKNKKIKDTFLIVLFVAVILGIFLSGITKANFLGHFTAGSNQDQTSQNIDGFLEPFDSEDSEILLKLEGKNCSSIDGEHCWAIEGSGNYFQITDTSYLDVTLTSSEDVEIYLESLPEIISFQVKDNTAEDSTEITLSGLENGKTYYRYEDGNLKENFTFNGNYSYTQSVLAPHHVFIKEKKSTIYILSNGDVSPSSAPITKNANTYTLTSDIYESIYVQKSGIVLDGANYNINGTGNDYGIYMNGIENVEIKNFKIDGFLYGIYSYYTDDSKITDNSVSNNDFGIFLSNGENLTVENNFVSGGIMCTRASTTSLSTIENNDVSNCDRYGIIFDRGSLNNSINKNNIRNIDLAGIFLTETNNSIVFQNELDNIMTFSIGVGTGYNNIINYNNVSRFLRGIYLASRSVNSSVNNNLVTGGIYSTQLDRHQIGIFIYASKYNILRNNELVNNSGGFVFGGNGLSVYMHDIDTSNTIDGKPVYYLINRSDEIIPSDAGFVGLINCDNMTIEDLDLSASGGVSLSYTQNSIIKNIKISNSFLGIFLYESNNNQIFHNTISENTFQIFSRGSTNIWDDGNGHGNYWLDYIGVDDGSSGRTSGDLVGDTNIPHLNVDNYPLLGTYYEAGEDVEVEASENVTIIFESADSGGITIVTESNEEPAAIEGFKVLSTYYTVETTTSYSGTITISIRYDDTGINYGQEKKIKLYHYNDVTEEWEDITTSIDTDNNIVYGESSSFSTFAAFLNFANAGGPYIANEGEEVILNASESLNLDNSVLEFRWDFNGDGIWDTEYSTNPIISHTWDDDYSGEVSVEVKYSTAVYDDTTEITINNVAPVVYIGENKEAIAGSEIEFIANFTDSGTVDTHVLEWDLGDGNIASSSTVTHSYEEEGEYLVSLIVTDDDGGVGQDTLYINISTIETTLDIDPNTINLKSNGGSVTAYIELSSEYDVNDINISTAKLNNYVLASLPAEIGDYDEDGISDLMLKFNREQLYETLEVGENVEISIKGKLTNGKIFTGSDLVKVK